ncbi:MAG TPA: hypothetical protein VET66_11635 [Steroidobacteraceae bacterium]|nr:hypothetical protein [Steroidobacteraceae bacterium]
MSVSPVPPVAPLSAWLRLMLAEIARKQEELEHARAEQMQRSSEPHAAVRDAPSARR